MVPEWTEERAIAALEENKQVMFPGLREQASGQKIYVAHEFAKLKGVMLVNPESMFLPDPFHPYWYASCRSLPRHRLDWLAANRGKHLRDPVANRRNDLRLAVVQVEVEGHVTAQPAVRGLDEVVRAYLVLVNGSENLDWPWGTQVDRAVRAPGAEADGAVEEQGVVRVR